MSRPSPVTTAPSPCVLVTQTHSSTVAMPCGISGGRTRHSHVMSAPCAAEGARIPMTACSRVGTQRGLRDLDEPTPARRWPNGRVCRDAQRGYAVDSAWTPPGTVVSRRSRDSARCRSRSSCRAASRGSTRRWSPSKSTPATGCRRSVWSACRRPRSRRRATACAPRCRTRSSIFRSAKFTVNLAPADLPKESGRFDLPIALGMLAATGQLPQAPLATHEFVGELALTGALRPIRGALAMTLGARRDGRAFVLPAESAFEAALVRDAVVYPATSLLAVCAHLAGREPDCTVDGVDAGHCGRWRSSARPRRRAAVRSRRSERSPSLRPVPTACS